MQSAVTRTATTLAEAEPVAHGVSADRLKMSPCPLGLATGLWRGLRGARARGAMGTRTVHLPPSPLPPNSSCMCICYSRCSKGMGEDVSSARDLQTPPTAIRQAQGALESASGLLGFLLNPVLGGLS